jgi:hypothetical protein
MSRSKPALVKRIDIITDNGKRETHGFQVVFNRNQQTFF